MRIQVMHLPAPADEFPFILILDEVVRTPSDLELQSLIVGTGAGHVLVSKETVEVA